MRNRADVADLARVVGGERRAFKVLRRLAIEHTGETFSRAQFVAALDRCAPSHDQKKRVRTYDGVGLLSDALGNYGIDVVDEVQAKSLTVRIAARRSARVVHRFDLDEAKAVRIGKEPVACRVYVTKALQAGVPSFTPRGYQRDRCPPLVFFVFPAEERVWLMHRDELRDIEAELLDRSSPGASRPVPDGVGFSLVRGKRDVMRMWISRAVGHSLDLSERIGGGPKGHLLEPVEGA